MMKYIHMLTFIICTHSDSHLAAHNFLFLHCVVSSFWKLHYDQPSIQIYSLHTHFKRYVWHILCHRKRIRNNQTRLFQFLQNLLELQVDMFVDCACRSSLLAFMLLLAIEAVSMKYMQVQLYINQERIYISCDELLYMRRKHQLIIHRYMKVQNGRF